MGDVILEAQNDRREVTQVENFVPPRGMHHGAALAALQAAGRLGAGGLGSPLIGQNESESYNHFSKTFGFL